jgi:hypothetical protein
VTRRRSPARTLALILLLAYSAILLLASWPAEVAPAFVAGPGELSRNFFRLFRTRAVNFLFPGRGLDQKGRRICVVVFGLQADGAVTRVYQPADRCHPPGVRLRLNLFDGLVRNLVVVATDAAPKTRERGRTNRWISSLDGEPVEELVGRLRSSEVLDPLSQFFCKSRPESRSVQMAVYHDAVDYRTGAVSSWLEVIHHYDCVGAARLDSGWLPAEKMRAAAPDLPLAPLATNGERP